jgi:AcrR family transcriptional regulator
VSSDDVLLDAAASVLAARPAASMDDVARAVGVSRATLFRRFPTRSALIGTLCRQAVESFVAATDPAGVTEDADPALALGALVGRLVPLGARYGLLATQPVEDLVERELLERAAAGEQRVRALVREGQQAGAFRVDVDPEWVLTALTWLLVGVADGVRLGRLAPARAEAYVTDTLLRLTVRDPR